MKKKIIAAVISTAMLLTLSVSAFAAEALPEDYDLLKLDGTDRVLVTSSYSPDVKDTSPMLDHRTGTACTFEFAGDAKSATVFAASRECEIVNKLALLADGEYEVTFAATNDADLKDWTEFKLTAEDNKGDWAVFAVDGIKEGYAFYRIEIVSKNGASVTVKEFALFRTSDASAAQIEPKTLLEKEQWRKVQAIRGFGFFGR